jgi:hypothetical protein
MWRQNQSKLLIPAPLAAILVIVAVVAGCEKPPGPFVAKSPIAPEVVYCNDTTGHKPGAKPFVMDGTCCCTPTEELMAKLQKDGFCQGMTAEDLRAEYEKKGIVLAGPNHEHCNGLCPAGPHVVLGGKCMCPPTPGTEYAEWVTTGKPPAEAQSSLNPQTKVKGKQ